MPAEESFEAVCCEARKLLYTCEGYFVDRVSFDVFGDYDELTLVLQERPYRPDMAVSLTRIYHFNTTKPPEAAGSFVDEFRVTYIPKEDDSWPREIEGRLGPRHSGLPDLVWIRVVGPMSIDAVASTITVLVAQAG